MVRTEAISVGPEVLFLRPGRMGRVIAVLRNTVYLESDNEGIVGIVGGGAVDGPLSLRVENLESVLAALNGREGASFHATGESLEIDGSVSVGWTRAHRWVPELPSHVGTREDRVQAARALANEIARTRQAEGFGALVPYLPELSDCAGTVVAPPGNALLRITIYHLDQFSGAMREGCAEEAAEALASLLGLGPGLTPSGDDLVAGILAMLVWRARLGGATVGATRRVAPTSGLVHWVRAQAPLRTNRISARLLWHAGRGSLYAPAMAVGAALLGGNPDAIRGPAQRLFSIGATSGVDLAAGMLFAASVAI